MNNQSRFIALVWLLSVVGMPVIVYLAIMASNAAGLPLEAGCQLFDLNSGIFLSILAGVPFATIITILSAFPILRNNIAFKVWTIISGLLLIAVVMLIIYQSGWCK